MENIPAGYRLSITSWENDADHYKDQIFEGLTGADVRYLVQFAKLFRSQSRHDGGFGGSARQHIGGADAYWTSLRAAIDGVVARHPDISQRVRESYVPIADAEECWQDVYSNVITELVSYPGDDYDSTYFRVYDSFKVHFFESPVEEVTDKFK